MTSSPHRLPNRVAPQPRAFLYNGQRIVHEFNAAGDHRLVIGTAIGTWATHMQMARLGHWYASSPFFSGQLPEVFRIVRAKRETEG
jgi:hypothetical protein